MLHGSHGFGYSYCHQMINQQQHQGPRGLAEVNQESRFVTQPMTI